MNELLLAGSKKFLFWLYKHFNKKLLKKYFPFVEDDFQIKLENLPNIYINEQINHCLVSFGIGLKNYTLHNLFISVVQINLVVNDYRLLNHDKILLKNLSQKSGLQFYLDIPLTFYQVRKILSLSGGEKIINASFELSITAKNIFGDIIINKRLFEKAQLQYVHM